MFVKVRKYCIVSVSIISSLILSACSFSDSESSDTDPTSSNSKSPGIQRLDNNDDSHNSDNNSHATRNSSNSINNNDNDSSDSDDSDSVEDNSDSDNNLSDGLNDKESIKQVFDMWVQFDREPLTQEEVDNKDVKYFIMINNRAMRDNKTIGNYAKKLSREQRTRLWKVPKIIGLYDLVQFDYSNPEQLSIVANSLAKKDKLYYKQQSTVSKRTIDRNKEADVSVKISGINVDGDKATVNDAGLEKNRDNLKSYVNSFKKKDGKWKIVMNDEYTHIINKHPVTMGYDPEYESPEVKVPRRDTNYYPDMSNDTDN